jgi:hypothetical protein
MENLIEQMLCEIQKNITEQKEEALRVALRIKGYGHLIDDLKKRFIFHRVASIMHNDWQIFFADNGEMVPDFIIAFKLKTGFDFDGDIQNYRVSSGYEIRDQYFPGEKEAIFAPNPTF